MNLSVRRIALAVVMPLAALLHGCSEPCDELDSEISSLQAELNNPFSTRNLFKLMQASYPPPPFMGIPPPNSLRIRSASSALLASAAKAPVEKRLMLKSTADNDGALSYFTFPNQSFGKFVGQVTVAFNSSVGLIDGRSAAFLEVRHPLFKPAPRRLNVAAVYDAANSGLRAVVSDENGTQFGTPIPFQTQAEIDLRIEQTATQLIFSARPTPADQSAGGWTPVYTENVAPDPSFFHVYIGARDLQNHAAAFFTNFALDGEAIGGKLEYPMINDVRASVEAIRAAEAKITASTPDLAGAVADLDSAITANTSAIAKLDFDVFFLQSSFYGRKAQASLKKIAKDLAAARAAVALLDAKKAAAQITKLDTVAGAQTAAMANLLGWSVPNLKSAPKLFSLRIP